jgi:hypothetical protein
VTKTPGDQNLLTLRDLEVGNQGTPDSSSAGHLNSLAGKKTNGKDVHDSCIAKTTAGRKKLVNGLPGRVFHRVRFDSAASKTAHGESINCETAEQVIAILKSEEAPVEQEILVVAQSIEPAQAVTRILGGNCQDVTDVPAVRYDNDIDAKIAEITHSCGLQLPGNAWRDEWEFVG